MRTVPSLTRLIIAAALMLLLSIRLLMPPGFMPAFDRTGITIVVCPDADSAIGPMPTHKHRGKALHQPCPYAAATPLMTLGPDSIALLPAIVFAAARVLGRSLLAIAPRKDRERPPAIGPPFPRLNQVSIA